MKGKKSKVCYLIDFTVPSDRNIAAKEREKLCKYADLKLEITKMWNMKAVIIPVVIGGTGFVKKATNRVVYMHVLSVSL